jgi:deazaflavin-dependent oxidoreductase (nitroreductase family)
MRRGRGRSFASNHTRAVNRKNRQVIEEFRANGGVVTVTPPNGPILLLHSAGARTGRELVTPLIFRQDGTSYVVAASMGGWKTNPAWYYNLVAHPDAWIEVGAAKLQVRAAIAEGPERERLFALHVEAYPQFDYYQGKTKRTIPVVVLTPR